MLGQRAELLYEIQGIKVLATDDRGSHSNKSKLIAERFIKRLSKAVSGTNLNLSNMGL